MPKTITLKEMRVQLLGWTQAKLAREMGVTRRTIANYEANKAPDRALKLAHAVMTKELEKRNVTHKGS